MGFSLKKVVPWGRSFEEYVAMFALSGADLAGKILDCGGGPASFNASLTRRGGHVISLDPLYRFSSGAIRRRIEATRESVMEQTRNNLNEFVWNSIRTVDELGQKRMAAMNEFLADYPEGAARGRYLAGELPQLPFADREFDLALCSHLLFLYSARLNAEFHVAAIRELCRVAAETRIFPLLELGAETSRHFETVRDRLTAAGYAVNVAAVPYEFQRGTRQMLTVKANPV